MILLRTLLMQKGLTDRERHTHTLHMQSPTKEDAHGWLEQDVQVQAMTLQGHVHHMHVGHMRCSHVNTNEIARHKVFAKHARAARTHCTGAPRTR